MPHTENTNGWDEYKRLVITELERANRRLDTVDKRLSKIERNIAVLQTKSASLAAGISLVISGSVGFLIKVL